MDRYYDWMNVDPHGNHNNHNALLINRDLYKANAALLKLENDTIAKIRTVAKSCRVALDIFRE